MDTNELRKAANCIFIAVDEKVAEKISDKLNGAAHEIDWLRDAIISALDAETLGEAANILNGVIEPACVADAKQPRRRSANR